VALALRRKGITRVRPLEGGLAAWSARGFPVVELVPAPARASEGAAAT
jgi:rhodanese-related sulfurtransferase